MCLQTHGGKRQTVSFAIAGDIPDLQSLHLKVLDNSVSTISPCRVGFVTHDALRDICTRYPRLAAAFWRETLIDAAIFREWVVNVGRREGTSRMAHVLCEFADALGFTPVHVNRVLQQLRAEGLIVTQGTKLTIPDWEKLKRVGEFDPTYLHLVREDLAAFASPFSLCGLALEATNRVCWSLMTTSGWWQC